MGRFLICATILLATAAITSEAGANPRSPGVNTRQQRQHQRIGQGIHSGELTRYEAHRLGRIQREVRRDERQAKRDGCLTPRERLQLQRELNRSSRRIYRLKHNNAER
jgi:hypothetical protein